MKGASVSVAPKTCVAPDKYHTTWVVARVILSAAFIAAMLARFAVPVLTSPWMSRAAHVSESPSGGIMGIGEITMLTFTLLTTSTTLGLAFWRYPKLVPFTLTLSAIFGLGCQVAYLVRFKQVSIMYTMSIFVVQLMLTFVVNAADVLADLVVGKSNAVKVWTARVMMACGDNSNDQLQHLKKIKAHRGLELAVELREWRSAAFEKYNHNQQNVSEVILIQTLMRDLSEEHPVYHELTTNTDYEGSNGQTPLGKALASAKRAHANYDKIIDVAEAQVIEEGYFATLVNEAYPPFKVPAEMQEMLNEINDKLKSLVGLSAIQLDQNIKDKEALEVIIEDMRTEHESRDFSAKQEFLRSSKDPVLREKGKSIARHLQFRRDAAQAEGMQKDPKAEKRKKRQPEFSAPQDMRALQWLCAHAVKHASGITTEHINEFRSMRMSPTDTPTHAVAKATLLADIIAESGVGHAFNYEFELTNLITNGDLKGGAFFTNALHEKIENQVLNDIKNKGWVSPTDNHHIRQLWTSNAEACYNQTVGRPNSKLMKAITYDHNHRDITNVHGEGYYKAIDNKKAASARQEPPEKEGPGRAPAPQNTRQNTQVGDTFYCLLHGNNSDHETNHCAHLIEYAKQKNAEWRKNGAGRVGAVTPAPGTDPTLKGSRQDARYNRQDSAPSRHQSADPRQADNIICPICSDLVGRNFYHGSGTCYMDPKVVAPDWFNPQDEQRRTILNKPSAGKRC